MTRTPLTLGEFLETALRSRLVDRAALAGYLTGPTAATAELVAEGLIGSRQLTRFQASKLLGGFWQGLIVGPYQLLCPIGRGGIGIVYLARDERRKPGAPIPRLVALKLLSPKRAREEPRTLLRFQHEMQLGERIPAHPQLARQFDAGTSNGVNYIAMEYVAGRTAKQEIAEAGRLPLPRAARIFADVASALNTAHAAGFVHRDVKPSNVVVTPDGRGKLLDFGFALRRGEKANADPTILGGLGYTLGTADYLPPEQATNAVAVGAETDIYSLGCSLYHALAGQPPFGEKVGRDKIRAHQSAVAPSLTRAQPDVPEEFAALVNWFLAKRPEDRPQSAAQVADELERFAEPIAPALQLVKYDAGWEDRTLAQVEAEWAKHRPSPPSASCPG